MTIAFVPHEIGRICPYLTFRVGYKRGSLLSIKNTLYWGIAIQNSARGGRPAHALNARHFAPQAESLRPYMGLLLLKL